MYYHNFYVYTYTQLYKKLGSYEISDPQPANTENNIKRKIKSMCIARKKEIAGNGSASLTNITTGTKTKKKTHLIIIAKSYYHASLSKEQQQKINNNR